ncbi:hypothetical protein Tsubulata_016395 [Turnera subulata]|uniref:WRKY domain-containing protein n=1 Tax=Turnera subulata TaxID=218843 RepID=A0A9Q0J068_9ROSI|nr:hypothetical protein Tsubulata_016395 [Turnera subulata]
MESNGTWEQKTLISELTQGIGFAKELKTHLSETSSAEVRDMLLQRILSSFENSLFILNWSGSIGQTQSLQLVSVTAESPTSFNESPPRDDFDGGVKDIPGQNDASKKRKTTPKWTDQVRVNSENGLEGPHDDGYSWRKYGQKDILGAKHPRSYYRCTYRNTQNCWATKQVQRSDADPTLFEINYRGIHTCSYGNQANPPTTSPKKREQKEKNNNNPYQQPSEEALFNFQKSLRVDTQDLDAKEMTSPFTFPSTYGCINNAGNYSPFLSPATPEPNYSSPFQINNFGGIQNLQRSESDFTEIISANTSATNSPIVDLDFSLESVELDPNFPFNTPFFS